MGSACFRKLRFQVRSNEAFRSLLFSDMNTHRLDLRGNFLLKAGCALANQCQNGIVHRRSLTALLATSSRKYR